MRKFLHNAAMSFAVLTALFEGIVLIQCAFGNTLSCHVRGMSISQSSSPRELTTYLFASVIVFVSGVVAMFRTRLGLFGMSAGYVVMILSYVTILRSNPPPRVTPLNDLLSLFLTVAFYAVAGYFEDDSKKNANAVDVDKLT